MRSRSDEFSLRPVTSKVYRGRSIWDYLSNFGFRVALFKVPFLYPTYEVNGIMISGFGSAGKFAAYPSDLIQEATNSSSTLLQVALFNALDTLNVGDEHSCVRWIELAKNFTKSEGEEVIKIASKTPWDFLFYVISSTDWVQHAFMDRILTLTKRIEANILDMKDLNPVDRKLIEFYREIDALVRRFLKLAQKASDYMIFIVSDHGFTIRPYTFNLAKWLVESGYMKLKTETRKKNLSKILMKILLFLYGNNAVSRNVIEYVLKFLPRSILIRLREFYDTSAKPSFSEYIDFESSTVFCLEDHMIYVDPSLKDTDVILDSLLRNLNNYMNRFYEVELRGFKREKVYWGDATELGPNLIIDIVDHNYIWEISTDLRKPLIFKPRLPGKHDYSGVFIAYGSYLRKDVNLGNLMIWDLAPTILHIFDVPIPSSIDGRVLKKIFEDECDLAKRPVKYYKFERERLKRIIEKMKKTRSV